MCFSIGSSGLGYSDLGYVWFGLGCRTQTISSGCTFDRAVRFGLGWGTQTLGFRLHFSPGSSVWVLPKGSGSGFSDLGVSSVRVGLQDPNLGFQVALLTGQFGSGRVAGPKP